MSFSFEWDESKNVLNQNKLGVSFEEATTVFSDDHALLIGDPEHSSKEDRFVLLGLSFSLRALVVCHCFRRSNEVIRIITARKASKRERSAYDRRRPS